MSRIMVPSKPSWKITIVVDSVNQAQITVEDLVKVGGIVGIHTGPRSMNQIELALLMTNIVSSTLVNTLNVSKRKEPDAPAQKTNND